MRIVEIGRFCAKLRAFEKCEKWRKMSDCSQIHVILKRLVIFRTFQVHVTLHRINRFQRFSSQIIPLFFYFNRFLMEYFLASSIASWKIEKRELVPSYDLVRVGTFLRARPSVYLIPLSRRYKGWPHLLCRLSSIRVLVSITWSE